MPSVPNHLTSVDVYRRWLNSEGKFENVPIDDEPVTVDWDSMSKAQVKKFVDGEGVATTAKMTKKQLIEAFRDAL